MSWESLQQLRVVDSTYEDPHVIHVLNQKYYEIGRLPRNYEPKESEILFLEPTLSRVHVTLTWRELQRSYEIVHKSDVNLSLVNGRPIQKLLLAPGDRIQLGMLILELDTAAPAAKNQGVDRTETIGKLKAIIARAEEKYAHVKLDSTPVDKERQR